MYRARPLTEVVQRIGLADLHDGFARPVA